LKKPHLSCTYFSMDKFLSIKPESTLKIKELIGRRIREERKALGMTLGVLSEKTGISSSHLSQAENGKKSLNPKGIETIASALDIRPSLLLRNAVIEARSRLPLVDGRYLSKLPDSDPIHAGINRIDSWDALGRKEREVIRATIAQHRLQVSRGALPHITEPLKAWMEEEEIGLIVGNTQKRPSVEWLTHVLNVRFKTNVTTPDMKSSPFHTNDDDEATDRFLAIRQPRKRWSRRPGLLHLSPKTAQNPFLTRYVLAMEVVCNVNKLVPLFPQLGNFLPENLNHLLVNQDLLIGTLELLVPHKELVQEYQHWLTSPPRDKESLKESAERLELPSHIMLIAMGRSLQLQQNIGTYALYLNRYNLDPERPPEDARVSFFIEPQYNYGTHSSVRAEIVDVEHNEFNPLCQVNAGYRSLNLNTTCIQEEFDSRPTGNTVEPSYAVISVAIPSKSKVLKQSVTLGIQDPRFIRALHHPHQNLANLTQRVETGYRCATCPANDEARCSTATQGQLGERLNIVRLNNRDLKPT
jgi:transcriptional regulator with XRE-family HTH domain